MRPQGIERTPSAAKLKGFLEDFARQSQESELHAEEGQAGLDGDLASASNTAEGGDAAMGEEALPTSGQAATAGPITAAADMMGTSRGSWSDVSGAESDDASSSSAAERRGVNDAPGCLGIDLWGELRSLMGVNGGISIHEVCADGSVRSIKRTRRCVIPLALSALSLPPAILLPLPTLWIGAILHACPGDLESRRVVESVIQAPGGGTIQIEIFDRLPVKRALRTSALTKCRCEPILEIVIEHRQDVDDYSNRRPALRKSKSGETHPQQSQGGAVTGLQRSLSPASLIKAITHLSTSILNKPRSSIVGLAESAYGVALDAKAPPPGVTASHAVSPHAVAAASP